MLLTLCQCLQLWTFVGGEQASAGTCGACPAALARRWKDLSDPVAHEAGRLRLQIDKVHHQPVGGLVGISPPPWPEPWLGIEPIMKVPVPWIAVADLEAYQEAIYAC